MAPQNIWSKASTLFNPNSCARHGRTLQAKYFTAHLQRYLLIVTKS
jgi:hypothetical protein